MKYRYFIDFSYLGTPYCGWQRQPNGLSVQEVLERCVSLKHGETVEMTAAGRTDSGVHALCMTAHFDTTKPWNPDNTERINAFLPQEISIVRVYPVPDDAHARFSALSRTYEYRMLLYKNPFYKELAWHIYRQPDIAAMEEATRHLYTHSEFTSFSKLHSDNKTDVCRIAQARFDLREPGLLVFTIQADRFLRNMVRAVVGTLADVGAGKISPEQFRQIIAARDRSLASMSAPAHGLYFVKAEYPAGI